MRVAIVHDALTQYGGAERVLEQIKAVFPQAPVMVAIHDPSRMPPSYRSWDIRTSWLNRIPFAKRRHRLLLPLYPQAIESFDFEGYDLVISSSYAFTQGVLTKPGTYHVNYCHSPGRFLWDYHRYAERERLSPVARMLLSPQLASMRQWDRIAADRPDAWIATSGPVQDRIGKYYGKSSVVIPPPVDVGRFEVGDGRGNYYLMLMRLVGWKRPDIVVEACTRLGVELVVAGDGRELEQLRRIAGPTVRFVGRVDDAQMRPLYRDCKAFILPAEEDFGITPLEAMASGRPVIALARGGVVDTLKPFVTGVFFGQQTTESLMDVLVDFNQHNFDPQLIRRHAEAYDVTVFRRRLRSFIDSRVNGGQAAARAAWTLSSDAVATTPVLAGI